MSGSIKVSDVQNAMRKSLSLLRKTYNSDATNTDYGWYHYLDDPKAGVTASAVALMCFEWAKERFERAEEVHRFLKKSQILSDDEHINGGWPIRTSARFQIIESTGWVIRSMMFTNTAFHSNGPDVMSGYKWIIGNQNLDNGWGSYYGEPSRTFLTALALLAVLPLNRYSREASLGADWLIKSQSPDVPAWGPTVDAPPSILHTSWALLALSEMPGKLNRKMLSDSLEWISANLDTKNLTEKSSQAEDYNVPYIDGGKQLIFQNTLPHFALPLAIIVLLKLSNNGLWSGQIRTALDTIVGSQNQDGFWELPRNPTRPSIWGIWPFVAALAYARDTPIMQNDMSLFVVGNNLVIQPEATTNSLFKTLLISLRITLGGYLKQNYGWIILGLFVIGGLVFVIQNLLGLREYFLSLLFPVILLLVQIAIEKRKGAK